MDAATLALGRRGLILGGLAACLPGMARGASPTALLEDCQFELVRKGTRIGTHTVAFERRGSTLQVSSDVTIAVKLAMVTLYRYRQTGIDQWESGKLVAADCVTDDNGTETSLELRAANGRLEGRSAVGRVRYALGTMMDLCFWNPEVVRQPGLIDSQTGEFGTVAMQDGDLTQIEIGGTIIEANHYSLAANKGRAGEVWYDRACRLQQAVIRTRGEVIEYRRLT